MKRVFKRIENDFVPIMEWTPENEDIIFRNSKGYIIAPITEFFNIPDDGNNNPLNYFNMSPKKGYNSPKIREKCEHYLNYFERFYDPDKQLLGIYCKLKYLIDIEGDCYSKDAFFNDIDRLILNGFMMLKITYLNRDNYCLNIKIKLKEKNLQYNNNHVYSMLKISTIMLLIIPLLTHFAKKKKILNIDLFLRGIYDKIIYKFHDKFDLESKLYESCISNVNRNVQDNRIWEKQDIRGINSNTHSIQSINNIIVNIMPQYIYNSQKNPVILNYAAIKKNIGFKVTDAGYEFDYFPLSSSNRDEDDNSELDKFESYLMKQDESLSLQNKVNCDYTMKNIENIYGKPSEKLIMFYIKKLSLDGRNIITIFQKKLLFYLFYKYFGDTVSINRVNNEQYVELMIIAKKMLEESDMFFLPWIISGRLDRLYERKKLNAKDKVKFESSPLYVYIKDKYLNKKIIDNIESIVATILSSKFTIIDPTGEFDNEELKCISDYIIEEVQRWALMI